MLLMIWLCVQAARTRHNKTATTETKARFMFNPLPARFRRARGYVFFLYSRMNNP
jgi:hypothetical protein